ncbi:MAG: TraR/DksA C4-type zinc finger protein [bacterium]|nr:TraR/DksA C4-type zinc finger protein [bacterium]
MAQKAPKPTPPPPPTPSRLAFLGDVKRRLQKEYDRLVNRISALMDKGKTLWQEHGDKEDDNASEVSEFQDTLSLGKNMEKNLDDVKAAMQQVDAGTYGICSNCGKPIEEARLKLVPSATLCIACVKLDRAA